MRESNLVETLLRLLFPPRCAGCDRAYESGGRFLCSRCEVVITWRDPVRCPICEHPTGHPGRYCSACQTRWPKVSRIVTLGYYAGSLKRALSVFKYGSVEALGRSLGEALAQRVVRELGGIDRVVPVPGGTSRARLRGFDPSAIVAAQLSRWLATPLDTTSIRRAKDGPSLVTRSRLDREVAVEGRFSAPMRGSVRGERVLVVDDVYTTGVSLDEVAHLLIEVGEARSVVGAVVARTVLEA